jgi:hypothetical protein
MPRTSKDLISCDIAARDFLRWPAFVQIPAKKVTLYDWSSTHTITTAKHCINLENTCNNQSALKTQDIY